MEHTLLFHCVQVTVDHTVGKDELEVSGVKVLEVVFVLVWLQVAFAALLTYIHEHFEVDDTVMDSGIFDEAPI